MSEPGVALTLQLLEWISAHPRRYREVLDAWKSSCPRLTIWEDACSDGLIDRHASDEDIVTLSARGRALLASRLSRHPSER